LTEALADIQDLLPEIAPLIEDETISEVMVNADGAVWIEKRGLLIETGCCLAAKAVDAYLHRLAASLGTWIDNDHPLLVARLPDGSRVGAAWKGTSVGGSAMSIRKHPKKRYSMDDLLAMESITASQVEMLTEAIIDGKNILISGGTGTGKTTMLQAVAESIPDDARTMLIEDTAEIVLSGRKHVVRYEARRPQDGVAEVTIRQLVEHSLRMRPDRLILGEVRGAEAYDLLQVLNSGHQGSLSTIHANDARKACDRLTSLALQAKVGLEPAAIRGEIGTCIDLIVHLARERNGKRLVREILTMGGYDYQRDRFVLTGDHKKPVAMAEVEAVWRRNAQPI
jgi:pilus assembly protein CpaF